MPYFGIDAISLKEGRNESGASMTPQGIDALSLKRALLPLFNPKPVSIFILSHPKNQEKKERKIEKEGRKEKKEKRSKI